MTLRRFSSKSRSTKTPSPRPRSPNSKLKSVFANYGHFFHEEILNVSLLYTPIFFSTQPFSPSISSPSNLIPPHLDNSPFIPLLPRTAHTFGKCRVSKERGGAATGIDDVEIARHRESARKYEEGNSQYAHQRISAKVSIILGFYPTQGASIRGFFVRLVDTFQLRSIPVDRVEFKSIETCPSVGRSVRWFIHWSVHQYHNGYQWMDGPMGRWTDLSYLTVIDLS